MTPHMRCVHRICTTSSTESCLDHIANDILFGVSIRGAQKGPETLLAAKEERNCSRPPRNSAASAEKTLPVPAGRVSLVNLFGELMHSQSCTLGPVRVMQQSTI